MTDRRVAVGVDVGGTKVLALALDVAGSSVEVLGENRRPTPETVPELIAAIEGAARDAAAAAGCDIAALGVGVPGLVDANGVMQFGANLEGMVGVGFKDYFAEAFGVPVAIDNDANVAAWGERVAGAGHGADHMLMVTLGTGIGGGIVLDGHLYRGANGMAGEIGHSVVQLGGVPCPCGQEGCWERYASGSALGRIAQENGFESGEAVVQLAANGDAAALATWSSWVQWVAIGLAGLANIFDPSLIVMGGGLVETGDLLLTPLRQKFTELLEGSDHRPAIHIVAAELGEKAGAIGAALIARDLSHTK